MDIKQSKTYLEEILPGFTITVDESYQGKPNNRFVFERDGVDAAMLFAQKLRVTKEFLQDVASAVNKRFNSPKAIEKAAEKVVAPKAEEATPEMPVEVHKISGNPSELEFSFYRAAKKVVQDFERQYPMT